jgi:hypothetical protein
MLDIAVMGCEAHKEVFLLHRAILPRQPVSFLNGESWGDAVFGELSVFPETRLFITDTSTAQPMVKRHLSLVRK